MHFVAVKTSGYERRHEEFVTESEEEVSVEDEGWRWKQHGRE